MCVSKKEREREGNTAREGNLRGLEDILFMTDSLREFEGIRSGLDLALVL